MWSSMLEASKMNPFVAPKCQGQNDNSQSLIPGRNIGAFSVAEGGKEYFLKKLIKKIFFYQLINNFNTINT